MKKNILIVLVLLLLLTACQTVTDADPSTASSVPVSSSAALDSTPSSSVTPSTSQVPTTITPATSVPATSTLTITPNSSTGYSHIHYENSSIHWKEYDFSNCVVGYLYWMDKETHKVTLLLAEQVSYCVDEGPYIYYVKETEPTKIYRMLIADPAKYELIHETALGAVRALSIVYNMKDYLQFVAGNQKFVIFDLKIGEETVLMEQYYLTLGYIQKENGTMSNDIYFTGQPTMDRPYTDYIYNRITGESEIEHDGDCDCDECV